MSTQSKGFTWGAVEHLFSMLGGLTTGVIVTAVFNWWVGLVLCLLLFVYMCWVGDQVPEKDRR